MSDLATQMTTAVPPAGAPSMLDVITQAVAQYAPAEPEKSDIEREPSPDDPEEVKNNVTQICKEIKADKAHFKDRFDRMRYDMKLAAAKNQWANQKKKE